MNSELRITVPSAYKNERDRVEVLWMDIGHFSKTTQFVICCVAVFCIFLIYGYMQELIFTVEGFKPYGWYLTLVQFGLYTIFGYVESVFTSQVRKIPLKVYCLLAVLTLGTMGFSNSSLEYLNYPTQVIFKCCKLIPVLVGGVLIQNKKFSNMEFIAALSMCLGLIAFTLADVKVSPNFHAVGKKD
uniref:Adenosine 3'-phospho 5'-phosphosulfate transporter 2 n=1 Tax=Cacopsylla melanoneura TaxID=428564 RepID=A0A8D8S654_9HEMI